MWRSKPMLVNGGNLGLQCLRQIKTESVSKKNNVEIRQCLVLKSSMTAWREKVTFWQFLEKMQLMYVAQALSGAPRPSSMAGMKHQGLTRPWRLRDPSHQQLCYHSTVRTVWTTQVHFGCSEKTEKRDITSPFSIRGWRIRQSSLVPQIPAFRCKTVPVCERRFSAKLRLCFGQGWPRGSPRAGVAGLVSQSSVLRPRACRGFICYFYTQRDFN